MSDDREAESRADLLNHAANYAFPARSLSPSATKLKSRLPGQIAKLKTITKGHQWIQELRHDPVKLKAEGGLLSAFCKYLDTRTKEYCDLVVSEDGYARNQLTQWIVSQKTGQSMTIKKHSRLKFWGKDEVQYVPTQEQG